jgi:outer membrane protein, heavy metal efflux system
MKSGIFTLFILFYFYSFNISAQDTLRINLKQADSIFLDKNLALLASRYQIDVQKAYTQQVKLWDNPTFRAELNVYNPEKQQAFDVGKQGEKIFSIEQIIKLGGKRSKAVALASENAKMTEYEFFELMRTLKFELRQNFFKIYFNLRTVRIYNSQLQRLESIIKAYETQLNKGNLPLKEVVRLKAIYYQLNTDKTLLLEEVYEFQSNLQVLLKTEAPILTIINDTELEKYNLAKIDVKTLQNEAIENRNSLRIRESLVKQAELNLKLQKSQVVPDLHLGGTYDQAGSYVQNYTGLTLGIDLPFFNRNQGNIQIAKIQIKQNEIFLEQEKNLIFTQVKATLNKLAQIEQEYQMLDKNFIKQFENLNQGITENFQKRNISLLEFTDNFETYNQSVQQVNRILSNRLLTFEELNFMIGKELFK